MESSCLWCFVIGMVDCRRTVAILFLQVKALIEWFFMVA